MRVFCCILVTLVGLSAVPNVNSQVCLADDIEKNTAYNYKARNLYKGLTIFTANFLDAMHKANPNDNLFFSPFSLYHALLLAYFGSANQTEKGLKVRFRDSFEFLINSNLKNLEISQKFNQFSVTRKFSNSTGPIANPMSSKATNMKNVSVNITKQMLPSSFHPLIVFTLPRKSN
jgi:serine protease inhibitor